MAKKKLSVYVDEDVYEFLEIIADYSYLTLSEVVRLILEKEMTHCFLMIFSEIIIYEYAKRHNIDIKTDKELHDKLLGIVYTILFDYFKYSLPEFTNIIVFKPPMFDDLYDFFKNNKRFSPSFDERFKDLVIEKLEVEIKKQGIDLSYGQE